MTYQERVAELERRFINASHPEIIDEKCSCGHWRTEHHDILDIGHGPCIHPMCPCVKFRWAGWIKKNGGGK